MEVKVLKVGLQQKIYNSLVQYLQYLLTSNSKELGARLLQSSTTLSEHTEQQTVSLTNYNYE